MKRTIITILFAIALVLLMAESEDMTVLLLTKALAFIVGGVACILCDYWKLSHDTD